MDINSVIILGHMPNVPLIWSSSELGYGLEPHGMFLRYRGQLGHGGSAGGWREVYPG